MKTTNFTEKQQGYIDARVNGLNRTQAAIAAGYSRAGADRQGSNLEGKADIKAAIKAAKRKATPGRDHVDKDAPRMKSKYASSLELLQHTYNNPNMPDSIRLRAAEQALPYEHGRVGEKGKKVEKGERAKELAKSSKFRTPPAPRRALTLLSGGKD